MGFNPEAGKFEEITMQDQQAFDGPVGELTPHQRKKRDWTQFSVDEIIEIKGIKFKVGDIGPSRLVLKPLKKEKD